MPIIRPKNISRDVLLDEINTASSVNIKNSIYMLALKINKASINKHQSIHNKI